MADDTGTSEDPGITNTKKPGIGSPSEDSSDSSLHQSELTGLDRACSVTLEQMFVDPEHRTCRVGSQTYRLSLYSRSPWAIVEGKGNNYRESTRSNLKNAEIETAGDQKASVSRQVYSVTNEDVGEMPGVKHSKTANIIRETAPYKCSRCSYASAYKCSLLRHERVHTAEKPYKCGQCSYASAYKCNLVVHERKHTGEKPPASYASARKSYLVQHERKHTGEKPYNCSHCSFANAFKSNLLVHERKHTGEKPYKCSHCSYASAHKWGLVKKSTPARNHTSAIAAVTLVPENAI